MEDNLKQLLLIDLCARVPYGVKIQIYDDYFGTMKDGELNVSHLNSTYNIEYRKLRPYLRPMSSMTEKEDKEWQLYKSRIAESCDELLEERVAELHDWFNRHHFDYRGLIPMGLALEAKEGMYKTE